MNRIPSDRPRVASRRGFTMVELAVSMPLMALLTAALVSSIYIATKALALGHGASAKTASNARVMEGLLADLRLALVVSERTATAIEFTVPDRDGDGTPESIRYEWIGNPTFELQRTLDLSTTAAVPVPVVVASNVQSFDLTYLLRTWGAAYPTPDVESDEVLLVWHDDRPEGDETNVLFPVANPAALSAQDAARKSLLEAWGFTVQLIATGASQVEFDAAVADTNVAYVSQAVDAFILGDKLNSAAIGCVTENNLAAREWGMASAFVSPADASVVQTTIGTHYVCQGFVPGQSTALFDSAQPIVGISAHAIDQAPDLQVLAHWGTVPALAVLERLGETYGAAGGAAGTIGVTTPLGSESGLAELDKKHVAMQIALSAEAKVTSLSAYLRVQASADLRFGIYSDASGTPGELLAQTANTSVLAGTGWRTIGLETPINLLPGLYWVCVGMQNDVALYFDQTGGVSSWADSGSDPRDGLMQDWTGTYGDVPNERQYSIYANYTETKLAAGRRLLLPWGGAGFDIGQLSNDGRALLKRAIEWAGDVTPNELPDIYNVEKTNWPAQYFRPALPSNASGWSVTRLYVAIKTSPAQPVGKTQFRLSHANASQTPGALIDETSKLTANETWEMQNFGWYEVPLNASGSIDVADGLCLSVKGENSSVTDSVLLMDITSDTQTPGTHFIESQDEGGSWTTPNETHDLRFYVYGKYLTRGEPQW